MCVGGEVVLRDRVSAACMCVCWKARLCFAWSCVCVQNGPDRTGVVRSDREWYGISVY